MTSALAAFQVHSAQLRDEIQLAPALMEALATTYGSEPEKLAALSIRARRQTFVSSIISLYGLIEESVDALLMDAASALSAIFAKHADLPEQTRRAHRELTLKSLLEPTRARLRKPLDEQSAATSLLDHLSGGVAPLTSAVMTYASANYRSEYIRQLLTRVDIGWRSNELRKTTAALTASGLDFLSIDSLLDDLVERRNEVAHAYETVDLLDVSTITAYLDVATAYITELHRIADARLLHHLASQRLEPIGRIAHYWKNALGMDMDAGEIVAPCEVLIHKATYYSVVAVESLQVNGRTQKSCKFKDSAIPVGLGIPAGTDRRSVGCTAYILPTEWGAVLGQHLTSAIGGKDA